MKILPIVIALVFYSVDPKDVKIPTNGITQIEKTEIEDSDI